MRRFVPFRFTVLRVFIILCLGRTRHQTQLDIAQIRNDIANHDEPIIFHVNLQVVRQVRALGEQHQVRKGERARYNLIRLGLGNRHVRRRVTHRDRLRCKGTLAGEGQCSAYVLDIHRLGRQQSHVTADLLEVHARHGDARGELRLGHIDVGLVAVEKVQLVADTALLLAVLQRDAQVIGLRLGHREGDGIVVRHCLDDTVKVVRVQTHIKLRSSVVILVLFKLGRMETHMRQYRASVVHGNHANAILIKDQAHLNQHGLQPLGEDTDGGSLNRLGNDKIVRHLSMLPISPESRFTRLLVLVAAVGGATTAPPPWSGRRPRDRFSRDCKFGFGLG